MRKTTPDSTPPTELLTEAEVSRLVNVDQRTLQGWRLQRRIFPFIKLGSCVRYPAQAVRDYLAQNTIHV